MSVTHMFFGTDASNGKWIRFQSHLPNSVIYFYSIIHLFIHQHYKASMTMEKKKARQFSVLPILWAIEYIEKPHI